MKKMDIEIYRKYDRPGPRYTSYPPANLFGAGPTEQEFLSLVEASNFEGDPKVSIYVHVPFCPHRCLFCGCNTEVGARSDLVKSYFAAMECEMEKVLSRVSPERQLSQVHFGGGTPNAVPYRYLEEILDRLRSRFSLAANAELAIECDPAFLHLEKLAELRNMGFNRISLGVQDFRKDVLDAVERRGSKLPVEDLLAEAGRLGFCGSNLDIMYGLPRQSPESFLETLDRTAAAGPDRIAVFGYAHLPDAKTHQKVLEGYGLSGLEERSRMLVSALDRLGAAGYCAIGMDHYAKEDDSLARARRDGSLHRNFQGYCTRETTGQVYGFGATAISQLESGFFQGAKGAREYVDQLNSGILAFTKGVVLDRQQTLIRAVINSLMCNGRFYPAEMAELTGASEKEMQALLDTRSHKLREFVQDNLVIEDAEGIRTTETGMLLVRPLAMLFDPLMNKEVLELYSRAV